MKRDISNDSTFLDKIILGPILILASISFSTYFSFYAFRYNEYIFYLFSFIGLLFAILFYKTLICLKQVSIDSDFLIIFNFNKEIRVHRSDIDTVSEFSSRPFVIFIKFKISTPFGKTIVFEPEQHSAIFSHHPTYFILKEFIDKN